MVRSYKKVHENRICLKGKWFSWLIAVLIMNDQKDETPPQLVPGVIVLNQKTRSPSILDYPMLPHC
jgi:hypothetical protein